MLVFVDASRLVLGARCRSLGKICLTLQVEVLKREIATQGLTARKLADRDDAKQGLREEIEAEIKGASWVKDKAEYRMKIEEDVYKELKPKVEEEVWNQYVLAMVSLALPRYPESLLIPCLGLQLICCMDVLMIAKQRFD